MKSQSYFFFEFSLRFRHFFNHCIFFFFTLNILLLNSFKVLLNALHLIFNFYFFLSEIIKHQFSLILKILFFNVTLKHNISSEHLVISGASIFQKYLVHLPDITLYQLNFSPVIFRSITFCNSCHIITELLFIL